MMELKMMELYHGSGEVVEYPDIRISRFTKDFSWGFYCTVKKKKPNDGQKNGLERIKSQR